MYRKILFLAIFLLSLNCVVGVSVDLNAHVYPDYTILNYIFVFNGNETVDKFSLEKPKDAIIDYIVDQSGPVQYEIAGDYIILKPQKVGGNIFLLKLRSKTLSNEIKRTDSFRIYQNFNFEVEKFDFKIILKENYGEIIDIFPGNYSILNNERIEWNQFNLQENSFYVINFKQKEIILEKEVNYFNFYLIGAILGVFLFLVVLLFFIYPRYLKKYLKKEKITIALEEDKLENESEKSVVKKDNSLEIKKEIEDKNLEKNNKFEEIIEKHLTENEKSIVQLVKSEEGISQYDILNYIPSLTKSNLSKIISKLHAKRILKRIKVGKVNNIYLGDKLKFFNSKKETVLEEEEEF